MPQIKLAIASPLLLLSSLAGLAAFLLFFFCSLIIVFISEVGMFSLINCFLFICKSILGVAGIKIDLSVEAVILLTSELSATEVSI